MATTDRPNILAITTDQHSKHVTGCYGCDTVRTPNIDRLAASGMRFDNAYCPAPLCVPSRMSFMTGRRPRDNRVWHNGNILHSAIPTWPHVLGADGYETSLIGRMHFMGPDQRHGFENHPIGEYFAGYPGTSPDVWEGDLSGTSGQSRVAVERAGTGPTPYQWADERVTDRAVEYLRDRAETDRDRPFAAVVSYLLPHCPFIAPEELFEYYYDRVSVPTPDEDQPESVRRFRANRGIADPPLDEERVRVARAAYFALCERIDALIGRVIDCLDETGLADETLVVYYSDHGEMAGEHGCWWKSNFHEGSVGVPLVMRLPGRTSPDSSSEAVVNLTDLAPTFTDVAGAEFDTPVTGRSLVPILEGDRPDDWTDETYSEFVDMTGMGPARMVRSGRWKLWDYPAEDVPPALFDLESDPDELNDLGTDPEYADVREDLLEKLYADWDPETTAREASAEHDNYLTLAARAKAVDPDSPDRLELPERDFRSEIDLR